MLVDDDPDDRMMITRAIRACSESEILEIKDGESLLARLLERHERQDGHGTNILVLLDINMPGIDGLETLAALKANEALRHIPTIMLTTSDSPESIARSYDLGANAYIHKPRSYKELRSTMEAVNRFWFDTVHIPPALRS